ncbi:MAG: enoyl-CoA hydratase/isomerase family protein [Promethearchaeota archaeon]
MSVLENILLEINDDKKYGIIYLNRPNQYNSLNYQIARELRTTLEKIRDDNYVNCLLITGKGKAFCSGGDLIEFRNTSDPQETISKIAHELHESIKIIYSIRIPVIAAINGACFGAGLGLASACDIRVCSRNATFGSAFTNVGLSPNSSTTYHLPRIIGIGLASDLILTNRILTAEEALKFHLVSRIIEPEEKFTEQIIEMATKISLGPPIAMALAKESLRKTFQNDLINQLELETKNVVKSSGTEDFKEGVNAFLEKRTPNYKGK